MQAHVNAGIKLDESGGLKTDVLALDILSIHS